MEPTKTLEETSSALIRPGQFELTQVPPDMSDEEFLILAEGRARKIDLVMQVALARTTQQDWTDFSGHAYLRSSGAQKLKMHLGWYSRAIEITPTLQEALASKMPIGEIAFTVSGTAGFRSLGIEGEYKGKRSGAGFFAERVKAQTVKMGIDAARVKAVDDLYMAALSNWETNAITRLLGLRGLSMKDLEERYALVRTAVTRVNFDGKPATRGPVPSSAAAASGEGTAADLVVLLNVICNKDESKSPDGIVRDYFQLKDKKKKPPTLAQIETWFSPKQKNWLRTTYFKIKEDFTELLEGTREKDDVSAETEVNGGGNETA